MSNQKLRKKLKRELSDLQRRYEQALREALPTSGGEWLSDNYYILAREGAAAGRDLRQAVGLPLEENGIPTLFYDCLRCCCGGVLPETETLATLLKERGLLAAEAQNIELMLRCALLHLAWEACDPGGEGDAQVLGAAIQSLRGLQETDFELLVERASELEQILMRDPSGIYAQMDERSRALYRRQAEELARKSGEDERAVAARALNRARAAETEAERHIGAHIWQWDKNRLRGTAFLVAEILLPAVVGVALGIVTRCWYLPLLIYLPLWELLCPAVERLSLKGVGPDYLPRLKEDSEAAKQTKTLITVSMLLPEPREASKLRKRLLELWQSNGRENIKICCLADLKAASVPECPEDRPAIAATRRVVEELNQKYGGGFLLAVRPRVYSRTQGSFTGKERKRGALLELVRAIQGDDSGFLELSGDLEFLPEVDYLLALDADTLLPMDTAAELAAVAAHPLNKPVVDAERGLVTRGYGIIVPRIENELFNAEATIFTGLLAGDGGITVYDSFASERYQDLFGEGIFSGKGLIDVKTFHALLDDAFPTERVLSHDILEGGYLRAGFASDIQAADGFPKRQGSYLARLNRWVRGDWQNVTFLFGKNPLSGLSRYKLLDNLRRSLTPIAACAGVLLSLLLPPVVSGIVLAVSLLGVAGPGILAFARCLAKGGPHMLSRLYYSGLLPAALSALLRAALALVMLPQTAWTCLDAILRALWRLFVSGKKLLEWTTAAQSEQAHPGGKALLSLWPSLLAGALLLVFGGPLQRLCGFLFLADIPFALLSGKPKQQRPQSLSYFARERLQSYAAAMWRYYEELCTQENNYLPPDNFQETPVYTVAHRTSPTNIGLALLCYLAARDLGLIGSGELYTRLEHSLSTIEQLEKWNGNLLNWYDTRSLAALKPKYVSTVDSGNFLCSLVALRQGLREYLGEEPQLTELTARIDALIAQTDLTPLYNARRRLFHIGVDLTAGERSPSYYDLLMSEARMTGYYAIASRAVPKKHWGAMGRMLVREGRYSGPVSWTGSMFEYFMPYLFLPAPKGSLGYEGLAFCLWCQKKQARQRTLSKSSMPAGRMPWGVSESGFYAFDRELNYQYKAHGVQKLGLKRGLSSELVVAPYASFLALPLAPEEALRNLRKLEKMEMTGRCGFYEAADFTSARTAGQDYAVVRSYMAHHVGMSLLSVLNTLKDNILQKRFLSDDSMAAAYSLLLEKIPSGAVIFKDVDLREVPKTRERVESLAREFKAVTATAPHVKLLTNGEWTTVLTDLGAGFSTYRGTNVTRHSRDLLRRPLGVFAQFRYSGKTLPSTKALGEGAGLKFQAEFGDNEVLHSAENESLRLLTRTSVHPRLPCEQRQYTIKNQTFNELEGSLILYFEPSLTAGREEGEHPAFSKLFLLDEYDAANRLLLFTRRPRGKGQPLCLAAGFLEEVAFRYETARERVLAAGEGIQSLLQSEGAFQGGRGNPDACAAFSVPLALPSKGSRKLTLLLACASTKSEAVNRLIRAREQGAVPSGKGALCPFAGGGLAAVLSEAVLPGLFYAAGQVKETAQAVGENTLRGPQTLWGLGISGDYPIIYVELSAPEDTVRAQPYLVMNKRLRACSVMTDVVLAYSEGGEYDTPVFSAVRELLKRENCEDNLGAAGGIHLINFARHSPKEKTAVMASACFVAPRTAEHTAERRKKPGRVYRPANILPSLPADFEDEHEACPCEDSYGRTEAAPMDNEAPKGNGRLQAAPTHVWGGTFRAGVFTMDRPGEKPQIPWSFVLSNPSFGTLVGGKTLGCTWAVNARENKLTPWYNDLCSDNRGELLLLKIDNIIYDLVFGSRATFTVGGKERADTGPASTSCIWDGQAGGLRFRAEVQVPRKGMVKLCGVELRNETGAEKEISLVYYCEPVLGVSRDQARFLKGSRRREGAVFNSCAGALGGHAALCLKGGADFVCFDRARFLEGAWDNSGSLPNPDPCVAVGKSLTLPVDGEEHLQFSLSWAANLEAALVLPQLAVSQFCRARRPRRAEDKTPYPCSNGVPGASRPTDEDETACPMENFLRIRTPDAALNHMVNYFLPSQIQASRLEGRTGFYQCGGAWGFRDQLQDAAALVFTQPRMVRRHLLRCCAVQFEQGDVLHWWYRLPRSAGGLRGVRSKCSDDLLWLPLCCADYVEKTGDYSLLEVPVPYISGPELRPEEGERYFQPQMSALRESVYVHCLRAIERALRFGERGLPLIGVGDWNDGFGHVGEKGRGESVWLALFLVVALEKMIPLCEYKQEKERAETFRQLAEQLRATVDDKAWDGDRYLRAFYDDGRAMGKKGTAECAIDSLPQSFSVFADMPDRERRKTALESALRELVDERNGIVKLFTPAFSGRGADPGYAASYPEGIRENGGQYTHAAVWLAMALLREGQIEEGYRLLRMLNPADFCRDPLRAQIYRAEPYALAGDVSAARGIAGRAGWSLYTGSAAWYYRAVLEELLGLRLSGGRLYAEPRLPEGWEECEVILRRDGEELRMTLRNSEQRKL